MIRKKRAKNAKVLRPLLVLWGNFLQSADEVADEIHQRQRGNGDERRGADRLCSVLGVQIVDLGEHGDRGGTGHCGDHGAEQHDIVCVLSVSHAERYKLGNHANDQRNDQQLEQVEQIESAVCKDGLEALCGDQRADDQHRYGQAKIAELIGEVYDKTRDRDVCLGKIENKTDGAGDRAIVEDRLFGRELDVIATARENINAERPDIHVEADEEERAVERTLTGEDRVQNRQADKAAVGKDDGENADVAAAALGEQGRGKPRNACHERMEQEADEHVEEPRFEHVPAKVLADESAHDHHRLTDGDDEFRETLGAHVVNKADAAADIARHQQQKEHADDGEQIVKRR